MISGGARTERGEQVQAGTVVAMLDTLPDGVCGTDLQERIRVINRDTTPKGLRSSPGQLGRGAV